MNDDTTTPELLEAEWEQDQVVALFRDLEQGAQIQHVQVRSSGGDRAVSLGDAKSLFEQRDAKAIQIRYQFEGRDWCDTLMIGPETTRVIRTCLAE